MTFYPTPRCLQAEVLYAQDGQIVENVLAFDAGHDPVLADLTALAASLVSWFDTHMKVLVHSSVSLNKLIITDLSNGDGPRLEYVTGLPIVGTLGGNSLPNSVSVAVKLSTNYRGRSSTGRIFHIGLSDGLLAGNQLYAAARSDLETAYNALIDHTSTDGFLLSVRSRTIGGVPRPTGLLTQVVTASIEGTVDVQRRRLPGRGQ